MIRCHANDDHQRFYATSLQIAAQATASNHLKFADKLRTLIEQTNLKNKAHRPHSFNDPPSPHWITTRPQLNLSDLWLNEDLRAKLDRVLTEQRERELLRSHGFAPMRKLLLVGPPGTGKTMTASVLAGELGLPLHSVRLESLISRFLGETAARLRLVFDAVRSTRGVYFFDEFDALGVERGGKNDVGEIHRVLNSLLQFLEEDDSESLLLCATNHANLLDRALFRRFDAVLKYELPAKKTIELLIRNRLACLDTSGLNLSAVAGSTLDLSYADIVSACDLAIKDAILRRTSSVSQEVLADALQDRRPKEFELPCQTTMACA